MPDHDAGQGQPGILTLFLSRSHLVIWGFPVEQTREEGSRHRLHWNLDKGVGTRGAFEQLMGGLTGHDCESPSPFLSLQHCRLIPWEESPARGGEEGWRGLWVPQPVGSALSACLSARGNRSRLLQRAHGTSLPQKV